MSDEFPDKPFEQIPDKFYNSENFLAQKLTRLKQVNSDLNILIDEEVINGAHSFETALEIIITSVEEIDSISFDLPFIRHPEEMSTNLIAPTIELTSALGPVITELTEDGLKERQNISYDIQNEKNRALDSIKRLVSIIAVIIDSAKSNYTVKQSMSLLRIVEFLVRYEFHTDAQSLIVKIFKVFDETKLIRLSLEEKIDLITQAKKLLNTLLIYQTQLDGKHLNDKIRVRHLLEIFVLFKKLIDIFGDEKDIINNDFFEVVLEVLSVLCRKEFFTSATSMVFRYVRSVNDAREKGEHLLKLLNNGKIDYRDAIHILNAQIYNLGISNPDSLNTSFMDISMSIEERIEIDDYFEQFLKYMYMNDLLNNNPTVLKSFAEFYSSKYGNGDFTIELFEEVIKALNDKLTETMKTVKIRNYRVTIDLAAWMVDLIDSLLYLGKTDEVKAELKRFNNIGLRAHIFSDNGRLFIPSFSPSNAGTTAGMIYSVIIESLNRRVDDVMNQVN